MACGAPLRSVAPRKEGARAVPRCTVPRRTGNARGAACNRNERERNDRRRMEILAKVRDEPMLRGAATVDAGSVELRR